MSHTPPQKKGFETISVHGAHATTHLTQWDRLAQRSLKGGTNFNSLHTVDAKHGKFVMFADCPLLDPQYCKYGTYEVLRMHEDVLT